MEGAETEEGIIYASTDPELRNVVTQADSFHNDQFQPAIQGIYELSTNIYTLQAEQNKTMDAMEAAFDNTLDVAEQFEEKVKEAIGQRLQSYTSGSSLLQMGNGLKSTIFC